MKHIYNLEDNSSKEELNQIFDKLRTGNSIVLLGAGASVNDKRYLGKEIIDTYENYFGKEFETDDLTEFVDLISSDPNFNRDHFDSFIKDMLIKLELTEGHKIFASIPYREIITTNYDILVEKAYDSVRQTGLFSQELKKVRHVSEFHQYLDNNQLKLIKLNGCISDKKKYPLVFSTGDFDRSNNYYKIVLNDLRSLSDKILFISFGYSFRDKFSRFLLKRFDSYNYRGRRTIYLVDPHINANRLPYLKEQGFCVINLSFQEFFIKYKQWEENLHNGIVKRKGVKYKNSNNVPIRISSRITASLGDTIVQLSHEYNRQYVQSIDFYRGAEPNFGIILRDIDVHRNDLINKVKKDLITIVEQNNTKIVPIIYLKGSFGSGKSTYTYRLIHSLLIDPDIDLVSFELLDFLKLRNSHLIDLLKSLKTKRILLYCDYVEVDQNFKSIIDLQTTLSIEQFTDFKVFFLIPIRENILEKYRVNRAFKNSHEIKIDANLTDPEIEQLLDKLNSCGLKKYRSIGERNQLKYKVKKEYGGDSFVTLLKLVSGGKHIEDLRDAFFELSDIAKESFLFTALLHRYKLKMPASLLKDILNVDWDQFTKNVIRVEGKGILIQEESTSSGTDPDLYFKTKHPYISEALVKDRLSNNDIRYDYYHKIFLKFQMGQRNSYLAINLLKAIRQNEDFSTDKLNKLYDICYKGLAEDPHFILNYSINLQYRKNKIYVQRAIDLIIYAESLLPSRNNRFIHRRAVLNFEYAKLIYKEEKKELVKTFQYLKEAEELFEIKLLLDPCSSYSYVNYIQLLFWKLENLQLNKKEKLILKVRIQNLLFDANKTVADNTSFLHELETKYLQIFSEEKSKDDYLHELLDLYKDMKIRPYICILLYKHYLNINNSQEWKRYLGEMESYKENNMVVDILFDYYGTNLNIPENRTKLFNLVKHNPRLEKADKLKYNFYSFVAESYNLHFNSAMWHKNYIIDNFHYLNSEYHLLWLNDNSKNPRRFKGFVTTTRRGIKKIKIPDIQRTFLFVKGEYESISLNDEREVFLHFYLYGTRAEIIS